MVRDITHLLNILGLGILAHHDISLISPLKYMMWKVSMSLFKAVVMVCKQPRKGNCVEVLNRWLDQNQRRFCSLLNIFLSQRHSFFITCKPSHGATIGNDEQQNITLKRGDELVV